MRITIIGLGLVAMSDALSLGRLHDVTVTGPVPDRIEAINRGEFPLQDPALAGYLAEHPVRVRATVNTIAALEQAELVLVASPLRQDPVTGQVDTIELESRIEFAHTMCPGVPIVIRSAVPIGFTARLQQRLDSQWLICAPEFRREGAALQDALHPARLVIGDRGRLGTRVGRVLASAALNPAVTLRQIGPSEAEAVRHAEQAYFAARVAYFNELDSYAMAHGLDARQVIDGVCLDPRIGRGANNPCFGFGGQLMSRSTRQLVDATASVPVHILPGIDEANAVRSSALAASVLQRAPRRVGMYRPGHSAPMTQLADRLRAAGTEILSWDGEPATLDAFKANCDVVIAQRAVPELADLGGKLFCRDHFAA
ncbi:hypothetical protein LCM17_13265 [Cereibacter sphaeroides]|nr:hypothetical protein [Cereibacter sphaeroides]